MLMKPAARDDEGQRPWQLRYMVDKVNHPSRWHARRTRRITRQNGQMVLSHFMLKKKQAANTERLHRERTPEVEGPAALKFTCKNGNTSPNALAECRSRMTRGHSVVFTSAQSVARVHDLPDIA